MAEFHLEQGLFYRRAVRELSRLLGCQPNTEEILARRVELPLRELVKLVVEDGGIEALLVDYGYPREGGYSQEKMHHLFPCRLEAILRSGKDIVFGTHVAGWSGDCTGVLDVQLGPGGDPLPSVAGHAMLICGYDRPEEYFIVKNSWGTDKGQDGYFYLSYDYIRTYAKYGYVIEEVKPIPLTPALQRMKTTPRMLPKLIQPESE